MISWMEVAMRVKGIWKVWAGCAAALALFVAAAVVSQSAMSGPGITVYKSPT